MPAKDILRNYDPKIVNYTDMLHLKYCRSIGINMECSKRVVFSYEISIIYLLYFVL